MNEGIPTIALYYRLISTITARQFPASHLLSRDILNLPVHQDIEISDLAHLTDRLVAHLSALAKQK